MKTITKAGAFILAGVLLLTAGCGNMKWRLSRARWLKRLL